MAQVPEPLMEKLRQATERFSEARRRIDGVDQMSTEHRNEIAAALRAAEREIEDVNKEIAVHLTPPPAPPAAQQPSAG